MRPFLILVLVALGLSACKDDPVKVIDIEQPIDTIVVRGPTEYTTVGIVIEHHNGSSDTTYYSTGSSQDTVYQFVSPTILFDTVTVEVVEVEYVPVVQPYEQAMRTVYENYCREDPEDRKHRQESLRFHHLHATELLENMTGQKVPELICHP